MPPHPAARALLVPRLFSFIAAVCMVLSFGALPALAASTLSAVRIDALPSGGALLAITFGGGVPSYHVTGAGTAETALLFDSTTVGPQVPPSVAGAGPITSLSIAQSGTSSSVALHLAAPDGVTVRVGGNVVFVDVAQAHPVANPVLPLTGPPAGVAGSVTQVVMLKYADVSEIAGALVAGSTIASNDVFVPQQSSLGTSSLGGSFGGITGSFSQPAQTQSFGTNPFGQTQGLAQRVNDNIAIDRRLNAIILTGTPDVIAPLRDLIDKLDVPVQSVILETQIIELDDSAARNIGLDLSPGGTGVIAEADGAQTGEGATLRTGSVAQLGVNLTANLYAQVTAGHAGSRRRS
jgi:general secretion pathway protein D